MVAELIKNGVSILSIIFDGVSWVYRKNGDMKREHREHIILEISIESTLASLAQNMKSQIP